MRSFWRLLWYIKNYKPQVSLNILSNILTAIFTVISLPLMGPFFDMLFGKIELLTEPQPLSWSFDGIKNHLFYRFSNIVGENGQLTPTGKETGLLILCGTILFSFFFKNLFRYLSLFFMAPVRNGIIRDLRKQLFDQVLHLPISFFSEEKKGDILSRVTADVQEVEWSILNVLEATFREPLIIIGALGYMLLVSTQLTLFVFLLIIFTAVVIGGIGKTLRKPSGIVQERLGTLVSILDETLGGLRVIKGFNAEKYKRGKFGKVNNEYRWALTRLLWRKDLASPLSEFLGISVVAILLWYGSRQVFSGTMEAGTFLSFLFAFYLVIDPSKSLTKAVYNIQKGIAAMERIEVLLDAKASIQDPPAPIPLNTFDHEVEYKNVSFAYNNREGAVLKNINFTLKKGQSIALVGASGAGKSTIADLLPRFYDLTEDSGSILIDHKNIKSYSLTSLRSLMGIVTQEAILFNDTIYNNIVFGLEGISPAQVEHAAKIANAHEFIMGTEKGYQTNIGDRGQKLSGGQRQRLTIARAILKNPPILILDEATSALDSESEKLVQASLIELMKNRTSIVIAHRLSTIQHANEILVMKDGKIIERGTHQSLLDLGGEYQKLVKLQAV